MSHEIKNDKILALLQIHDTFVGEEPKVEKSKWAILKQGGQVDATGIIPAPHIVSDVFQIYQSQLEIDRERVKGKSLLFDKYVNEREDALLEFAKKTDKAIKY